MEALTAVYRQLNAPFGDFAMRTMRYDTRAVATDTPGDAAYAGAVAKLNALLARRDALVPQIQAALNAGHGDAALLEQANQLIGDAVALGNSTPPMPGDVSGTVPATLSLTLGPAASFGAFAAGVEHDYSASTTADVVSTAGDAALSVSDPGHLANGTFELPSPLQVLGVPRTWSRAGLPRHVRHRLRAAHRGDRRAAHRDLFEDADLHAVYDDTVASDP